jgi:hypothetical protein
MFPALAAIGHLAYEALCFLYFSTCRAGGPENIFSPRPVPALSGPYFLSVIMQKYVSPAMTVFDIRDNIHNDVGQNNH